ncbi:PDC sensor domain-containing protein [Shewanella acanthi]|uniref:PDC sensor domain-containing protein n=1 Tax=Shewanella acanthi TaxID=2864212 RepID=UPI001C65AB60|nr:cache domain-containing protein [Shewanella acanthi]QYJ80126.1 PAS domain-containing protein [Shewanella acanthi]
MDIRSIIAPKTQWHNSLPFKLSLIQLIIATLLIFSTAWVILTIQSQQLNEQQSQLNQNQGQMVIAKLQEMTSQIETQVNSISNIAKLYRYQPQALKLSIPVLLNTESHRDIVLGGGVWPEPYAFDPQKPRDSLFWARDAKGDLQFINSYNDEPHPNYQNEEWYRPTRLLPAGKTYWSKSYIDKATHEPMVTAASAIWMEHQFIGAATTDISLDKLNILLRHAMADVSGYVIALDRHNQILASPPSPYASNAKTPPQTALLNFSAMTEQQIAFTPILQALQMADEAFIAQSKLVRVFSDKQLANLKYPSHAMKQGDVSTGVVDENIVQDNVIEADEPKANLLEADLLEAIVNDNATQQFSTPRRIASVSIKDDPLLNSPAIASIFLMPHTYWKIVVVTPVAPLEDTAKTLVEKVGLYLVLIQVLGLFLLFILQHKLVIKPIIEMVKALKHNDPAKLEHQASNRSDEVGLLAKSLINRTEQLEVAMASLDASNLALEQQLQNQDRIQQQLKGHKEQLNSLLEFSPNIVYIKNREGKYTLVNDKYCALLATERKKILGVTDFELFPSQIAEQYRLGDLRVNHSSEAIIYEESFASPQGELIYQITKFEIKDEEFNPIGIGAIGIDISLKKRHQKEQEQVITQLQTQLEQQQLQTQLALQQIGQWQAKIETKDNEIAKLRQQLTSQKHSQKLIQHFLAELMPQLVLEQDQALAMLCQSPPLANTPQQAHIANMMSEQATRLRQIAPLFIDEASNIRPLHLSQFINSVLYLLAPTIKRTQVTVNYQCDEHLVIEASVWHYLQLFYRLLNNSLQHAFKEHQQHRQLNLTIEKRENQLQVKLEDNGCGIPSQQLIHLHQQMAQGVCVGSLSCLNVWIHNEMKGEMRLSSELSKGTCILCHWPV